VQLGRFWVLAFSALLLIPFLTDTSFSEIEENSISTEKDAYAAGETITVTGHVSTNPDAPVLLQIVSPNGTLIRVEQITADSENNFSINIATSIGGLWKETGTYTIKATHFTGAFESQFEYGGLMQAQVNPSNDSTDIDDTNDASGLEFSSVDELSDYNTIEIEDNSLFYKITGGEVLKVIPDTENTSLIIQIETFSDGDLLITLPKTIIDTTEGDFFVLVDGEETVFYTEQTSDSWTLRIPFYNGSEEIEIIGTFVIPEFGTIAAIILAVAITSIIVLSAKTKLSIMPKF
jgi:predicted secreted protein with PEFG-CTERM motif